MTRLMGAVSALALVAAIQAPAYAQQGPADPQAGADGKTVIPQVVTIYADRQASDPGSVSVIDTRTIESIAPNTPAEILNTVPGVNIQMNSGQENLIALRSPVLPAGAGQGSFLVLENGLPTRAPGFGNVNELFELQYETAGAIEVVRGPGSVKYGSNAVHGLFNVIAPEPGQVGYNYSAMLSASSLQRYRADSSAAYSAGGVDMFAALSLTDDNGWRDASGVDMQKLTWRAGADVGDWRITAGISGVNLNQETAGFLQGTDAYKNEDTATTNANPEAYRDAWSARANVRFERDFGPDKLTITPYGIMQRMIFIQHFLPDQSTEKNGHDSVGLNTRYDFGAPDMRWTVGADLQWAKGYLTEYQSVPTFGAVLTGFPRGGHYDYEVDALTVAAYAEVDWDFATDWSLVAGLRAESHGYDYHTNLAPGINRRYRVVADRTDAYDLFTPKFGLVYSGIEGAELYANYARGERAPQTSDQYRLQRLQTEQKLEVETLDSFEIGVRGQNGPLTYDLAAYTMEKDNFFFRDADGFNVPNGKTQHVGAEAQLAAEYDSGIYWHATASWSDQTYAFNRAVTIATEIIRDGDKIDTAPEWLADAAIGWRNERFSLELGVDHVGEYFTDAANLHTYPGHTVGSLRGSWKFTDDYEAFVILRNVTDERYADRADFASGQERYFPGEPANVTIGVRVKR